MDTGGEVKLPGDEANHSPHLLPRSRMVEQYFYSTLYIFMAWCLIKHIGNFASFLFISMKDKWAYLSFIAKSETE
jgi:hypothetical protein